VLYHSATADGKIFVNFGHLHKCCKVSSGIGQQLTKMGQMAKKWPERPKPGNTGQRWVWHGPNGLEYVRSNVIAPQLITLKVLTNINLAIQ
jgi:hypothetical protein